MAIPVRHLACVIPLLILAPSCKSKQRQTETQSHQQQAVPAYTPPPKKPIMLSETYDLPEGNYKAFSAMLSTKQILEVDVKVVDGKGVDLIVMTDDNFKLWSAGKAYRYYPGLSSERTVEYNRKLVLDAGKYCVITRAPGKTGDELPVGVLVDLVTGNYLGALKGATKEKPLNLSRVRIALSLHQ